MHDAVQMERKGVPTVTLTHDKFESAARAQAKVMGMHDLHLAVVSQETYNRGTPEQIRQAADSLYSLVLQGLTAKPKIRS